MTWLVLLALLALAVGLLVAVMLSRGPGDDGPTKTVQATPEQIEQQLDRLQQDFQTARQEKQDITRIAALARAFTEDHPEVQGGFVLLAQALIETRQWDQAYTALQRALKIDTSTFELSKLTGFCAAKLGRSEEALDYYQQAAEQPGADYKVFTSLGQLHMAEGDPGLAEQMFTRAIDAPGAGEKTNYRHEAYAGLADVATMQKQFEQAFSWVDRAIRMAGLDSEADTVAYHIQKARIYMEAGQDEDAVTMLSFTWSQFAESPWRIESARLRARLYERAGQLDAGVDYLQTITEWLLVSENRNNETLADFTALLGHWQAKANRIDAARISLHNLQALAPGHPAIEDLKENLR